MQKTFLVDMTKCYGCRTCEIACKSEYDLPVGVRWRRVIEIKLDKPLVHAFLPMSCNHCSDAPCMKECPVGAYHRRGDGIILQDHNACIGCETCVKVCPYGAPQFDPVEGKSSKCSMCVERQDNGLSVRCVDSCPAGAIMIGDREELKAAYPLAVLQTIGMPASNARPNVLIIPDRKFPKQ